MTFEPQQRAHSSLLSAGNLQSVVGQERAIRLLNRMVSRNRVPHALLFSGLDGCGRQTTARALAMELNCQQAPGAAACGDCRSCRKVLNGTHPDVLTIGPAGRSIKIEQVRALAKQLRFAPLEGPRRVVIVNDAQAMTQESANAILKVLEEPPGGTVIVLTAPQVGDLLPTVVSRCQHIGFQPIPVQKIAQVLIARKGLEAQSATALATLAKGSMGRALSSGLDDWVTWRSQILERIAESAGQGIVALFSFSQELARDKKRLDDALGMIALWYRDLLMFQICPELIVNTDHGETIEKTSSGYSAQGLLERIEAVFSTHVAIRRNANARLALDVMMTRLA